MDLARPILRKHRGYTGARLELMKKAASLSLEGATIPEIAKELSVSQSTVRRLLKASEGLPTKHLSETAQVARLMELQRTEGVMREFFPIARRENVAGVEPSFNDSLEAAKIILSTIDLRMKLLRYEETPAINYRKLQADVRRLLS
jgi:hypothetical protein